MQAGRVHTEAGFRPTPHHRPAAVTKRIPQPRAELAPGIRAHEAQLLTVMLRTARLTCVFSEAGADKSAFLTSGVMPLLRRRQPERSAPSAAPAAPYPGSERRRAGGRAGNPALEAALYFDEWNDSSLAALKTRLGDLLPAAAAGQDASSMRLAELLRLLTDRAGCRLFLLLDRFEEFLKRSPHQGDGAAFADELVESLLALRLAASFVISVDESARSRLERFRTRVPDFDHNSLRLSPIAAQAIVELPLSSVIDPVPASDTSGAAASTTEPPAVVKGELRFVPSKRKPQRREPPPRVPIKVDEVYAFIEATLTKSAAQRTGEHVAPAPGADGPVDPACPVWKQGTDSL